MRIARLSTIIAGFILGLIALAPGAASAGSGLDGRYFGVDAAEGAMLEIAPEGTGFEGVFRDRRGRRAAFTADRRGESAQAIVEIGDGTVLIRVNPMPYGADVALIPFDGQGRLRMDEAEFLNLVREGLDVPRLPEGYRDAPRDTRTSVTANSFLISYEFWTPTGVRNGYLGLPGRFRTVIRLFPAVQLDVIWKLCLAPQADRALAEALRGQGVDCETIREGLAEMQRNGRFNAFKREVQAAKEVLLRSVRCADRYVMEKSVCERAARQVAEAAVALETAGSVLARYRQ